MINRTDPTTFGIYKSGDITFELFSSCFLWLLIPGCGFFYSGLARSRDALTMLMTSFWSIAVVSIQWWLIGYSLVFSQTETGWNWFIGDFKNAFLIGVWEKAYGGDNAEGIPELVFCFYQCITACIGPSLILGTIAGRGRIFPAILFVFIWSTFVFDVVAYWSLNPNGWSAKLGVLDFGGGSPVHVPAAAAALAYSILLGPRESKSNSERPHNMINLVLGTLLIWFGSFGNNIGASYAADMVAISAGINTNLAGSAGALTWALIDYWKFKHWSAVGFCCGGVAGVVAITPGSGFVSPTSSVFYGIFASVFTNFGLQFTNRLKFDDALDVFVVHGSCGVIGNVLTGILAQKSYGGHPVGKGGWIDGHWLQVPYQIIDTIATFTWSFVISYAILYVMNQVKFLKLRVTKQVENFHGLDKCEMGIECYEFLHDVLFLSKINHNSINLLKWKRLTEKLIEASVIDNERTKAIYTNTMESWEDKDENNISTIKEIENKNNLINKY